MKRVLSVWVVALLLPFSAWTQSPEGASLLKEDTKVTEHKVKIEGKEISFKAVTGNLLQKGEKEEVKASLFYTAYFRQGVPSLSRPITFCFNGGPGSSSVWLHMGAFGPKKVNLQPQGYLAPPYSYVDNEWSLLDVSDLVFIDPVSTGYSKVAPGEDPKQFYGVEEDIKSVAEFIRLFITKNNRWLSPKFLAGESYGTTRAVGLAQCLQDDMQIYVNGVILLSSILYFQVAEMGQKTNDLTFLLYLPAYTATAWYHQKLSTELQQDFQRTLLDVRQFALGPYAIALLQGDLLSDEQKEEIAGKLSLYTGLTKQTIKEKNLRIGLWDFMQELLYQEKEVVGRFDSRFKGGLLGMKEQDFYDPSYEAVGGLFTSCLNDYLKQELGCIREDPYQILANVFPWNWGVSNAYLDVSTCLRSMMIRNPSLQVLVASGYYDLATPFSAADYTFMHLNLPPALRSHITMAYYEAGHMMYLHHPSKVKLKKDVAEFIEKSVKEAHQLVKLPH